MSALLGLDWNIYTAGAIALLLVVFAIIILTISIEVRRRRVVSKYFEGHVSEEIFRKLQRGDEVFGLHGEERIITVFFNDIRSFSELSEKMSNKQVMEFISHYYSVVSKILLRHDATIDKFLGDGVMAFWGAPLFSKLQAYEAATASLELLNAVNSSEILKNIDIGVGINTGRVIVGNLGKAGYTVIGDNVNIGSRLESLTKQYGCKLLVTDSFINKLEEEYLQNKSIKRIFYREIDMVKVFGKAKKVGVYELIDFESKLSPDKLSGYSIFEKGLILYRRQNWDEAIDLFRKAEKLIGNDSVSRVFISRCQEFKEVPYHSSWDGHYMFNSK